jgi:hypothetical protein
MLLGFELFGLGVPTQPPCLPLMLPDLSVFALTFPHPPADYRASGVVRELLQAPLAANASSRPPAGPGPGELSLGLLIAPLLASCLAYCAVAVGFRVSSATAPAPAEAAAPQKIFCFQAIYRPEIRLAPPRCAELPCFRRAGLWQAVMAGGEARAEAATRGFSPYLPPAADLEAFDPVPMPPGGALQQPRLCP